MQVRFWGTRGSLPVAMTSSEVRRKIIVALETANGRQFSSPQEIEGFVDSLPQETSGTWGGNSPCVEILGGETHVICDMGSGARPLGNAKIVAYGPRSPQTYHVFLSHLHWDHLMGLPFFTPIYIPGNRMIIHGCHPELAQAVKLQMAAPCFPVDFSQVGATVEFDQMTPGATAELAGFRVTPMLQLHGGDSYGYRFEKDGKAVVYSTDSEHKLESTEQLDSVVNFFRGADLVIFDAMYSLAEAVSVKADWGHSSNIVGVELCQKAGVKTLALFHHEPINNDYQLAQILSETRRFEEITRGDRAPLQVISSYDGLIVTL